MLSWLFALAVVATFAVALWVAWGLCRPIKNRRKEWKRLASGIIVVLIAFALFGFPLGLFLTQAKSEHFSTEKLISREPVAEQDRPLGCTEDETSLTLTILRVDFALHKVELSGDLCISKVNAERFKTEYATSPKGNIALTLESPTANWSRLVSVSQGERDLELQPFTLPLTNSGSYPLERQQLVELFVRLGAPSGPIIHGMGARFHSTELEIHVQTATGGSELQWTSGIRAEPVALELQLVGQRRFTTRAFVAILMTLPLLLFLALLFAVRAYGRRRRGSLEAGLIAGVGAFLIAVLPIREVLVPSEIPGFTLVDYGLGAEMAVMVAATLVVVWSAGDRHQADG